MASTLSISCRINLRPISCNFSTKLWYFMKPTPNNNGYTNTKKIPIYVVWPARSRGMSTTITQTNLRIIIICVNLWCWNRRNLYKLMGSNRLISLRLRCTLKSKELWDWKYWNKEIVSTLFLLKFNSILWRNIRLRNWGNWLIRNPPKWRKEK